jgi:hypothetical protein
VDRKRVHPASQLVRKRLVDHAMTLDPALSFECFRHNMYSEMSFSARPMAGMSLVLMGLVRHFEAQRRENPGQLLRDDIADWHAPRILARCGGVNVPVPT